MDLNGVFACTYTQPSKSSTTTMSPSSLLPRTFFGTAKRLRPSLARQTLQDWPSTVARTGVRPQACVARGACRVGMGANTQPPFPGTRNNVDLKRLEAGGDRRPRWKPSKLLERSAWVPNGNWTGQPKPKQAVYADLHNLLSAVRHNPKGRPADAKPLVSCPPRFIGKLTYTLSLRELLSALR